MKKFISMVMAAAMVVSLVPATAFAADNTCTMKVVKAAEATKTDAAAWATEFNGTEVKSEVQITIGEIDSVAGVSDSYEIDLDFDGAKIDASEVQANWGGTATLTDASANEVMALGVTVAAAADGDETLTLTIAEPTSTLTTEVIDFAKGDIITLPLKNMGIMLKSVNEGATASVAVSGELGSADAKVFATVVGKVLKVSTKKVVEIGEELGTLIKDVKIKTAVGKVLSTEEVTLKLNKGFVFANTTAELSAIETAAGLTWQTSDDDNVLKFKATADFNEKVIAGLKVEAVTADAGDVATIKVSVKNWDSASVDVATVVEAGVKVSVDEDLDVPEMYSGTDATDAKLNSTGDHKALTVTFEETVADAWDLKKGFTMTLPEGVYVVEPTAPATIITGANNIDMDDAKLAAAYKKGDFEAFDFGRRALTIGNRNNVAKFDMTLTLVAEPGFVGDVVLTVEGDGIGSHEVVIAKFVAPYTVEAAQNDVIIDYRNTEVPTDIVVKEAEAGLWVETATGSTFTFKMDQDIEFEDGYDVAVDEASEAKVEKIKGNNIKMAFDLKEESNEEAAAVTLNGIELYMYRSLPAGAYDLQMFTSMGDEFMKADVFDNAATADSIAKVHYDNDTHFVETVKEGWINIVTAGRDKDDASFTKKVIVPVGESYLIAGEETVALDVPAYINANDYTMLPVRAVATALGIHNNNVIWSDAAKQVTILYGQRIITMTVGQSVIYVNGSAIPAKAAVEVVNGRAFLGFRDLANALGVVEIDYVDGKAIMN